MINIYIPELLSFFRSIVKENIIIFHFMKIHESGNVVCFTKMKKYSSSLCKFYISYVCIQIMKREKGWIKCSKEILDDLLYDHIWKDEIYLLCIFWRKELKGNWWTWWFLPKITCCVLDKINLLLWAEWAFNWNVECSYI